MPGLQSPPTIERLAAEVAALRAQVEGLAGRLERVEGGARDGERAPVAAAAVSPLAPAPALVDAAAAAGAVAPPPPSFAALLPTELTLVGRLVLVLAGAFLLRALTEAGELAVPLGVALGLAYALAWLPAAVRATSRGDGLRAAFHGAATTAIAYPLIWEAATRFRLLGGGGAALGLAAVALPLLAIAGRQRAPVAAWLVTGATLATAAMLMVATRQPIPFAAVLVGLGAAALLLGERHRWPGLPWVAAGAADLAVAMITFGTLVPHAPLSSLAALPVQLALALVYLGAAWLEGRRPAQRNWPLLIQAGLAVVVGYGGAVASTAGSGLAMPVAALGVALAAAVELAALRVSSAAHRGLFLAAALAIFLAASGSLLTHPALLWAVLAVAAAVWGRGTGGGVELQAAALALAATVSSGVLAGASLALLRPGGRFGFGPLGAAASLLAVGGALVALAAGTRRLTTSGRAALALLLLAAAWLGAGAIAGAGAPWLAADPGLAAALGTAALVAAVAVLAWAGRGPRLQVATWLVYPLLVVTAAKLALVDLPRGRPLTLFLSLAALGAGLLASARRPARTQP